MELAPRLARLIVAAVFAAFAGVYAVAAAGRLDEGMGPAGAIVTVLGVLACQLVFVLPRLERLRGQGLLAVQALLACLAVLAFGTSPGLFGFVVATALAVLPVRVALPLGAGVVASGVAVAAARIDGVAETLDASIGLLLSGPLLFGLGRLSERVGDLSAARLALAMAAAEKERLRIATELGEGLGRSLDAIAAGARRAMDDPAVIGGVLEVARRSLAGAREAAAGLRSLSLAPEAATARALLGSAGIAARVRVSHGEPLGPAGALLATVLREAVTDVVRQGSARNCLIETSESEGRVRLRVLSDGVATVERGADPLAEAADRVRAAGGTMSVRLGDDGRLVVEAAVAATPRPVAVPDRAAYWLLVALMIGFSFKGLLNLPTGWALLPGACFLGAACAMQLHWAWRERPRSGPWALAVLALLSLAPLPLYGEAWLGAAGFLIGPLLLALPARLSWPLSVAVLIATATAGWQLDLPAGRTANFVVSALVNGLIVYGLVRLARLIRTLQAAADELARTAMVQERLRAARDLHDLLGHSLAAILLKCELARRLGERDPVRARAELDDVLAMTERARADMRAVSGAAPEMSLEAEAESARSVLAAAGVETELEQARAPLAADVSTVLSAVLREAVTNTLRHSAAGHCRITISADPGSVRLVVENDGLPTGAGDRPPGSGLGNLTTRLAALGGSLTARRTGEDWFRLTASVPVKMPVTTDA